MTAADALKAQGNAKFQAQQYHEAVELYSKAIAVEPSNSVLYSNRSVSQLLLGHHQAALADAVEACTLRPDWDKAHFRRGAALEAMEDLGKALLAYERALDLNPVSQEVISKVRDLKKKLKAQHKERTSQQGPPPWIREGPAMRMPEGGASVPAPSSWSQGLSAAQQAEWLVDCYRMRVDDYVYGAGNLHGLYDPEATKDTIAEDFLIFCKLAVQHGVIPPGWDWAVFLQTAAALLPYAFEKSDAKDKWGGENVFRAMLGGSSLRFTGEVVYGKSCMYGSAGSGDSGKALQVLWPQVAGKWKQLIQSGEMFGDVGGVEAWQKLHSMVFVSGFC